MFSKDDLAAAGYSEILAEYLQTELRKETYAKHEAAKRAKLAEETASEDFLEFQAKVNATPALKATFKQIQAALISNPEYAKTVDANFVAGVMLLKIED